MAFLDATSIEILLPTLVLLALIVAANRHRFKRREIPLIEEPISSEQPIELQIYDPPLSKSELKFVTGGNHIHELHGRPFFIAFCFNHVMFGIAATWLTLAPNDLMFLIVGATLLLDLFFTVASIFSAGRSCNCGSMRLLTAKHRLDRLWMERSYAIPSLKRELLSLLVLLPLCCASLGLFLFAVIGTAEFFSYLFPGARVAMAAGFALPTAMLAALGTAFCFADPSRRFLTKSELQRVTSLSGDTVEELNELISFYLHIGNFRKADEFSQKLLAVSEQSWSKEYYY